VLHRQAETPARVRTLSPADIPAAMRIKEAAGWNQTGTDWRNLLRLAPDTCFGIECEGRLAATTTAVCYERKLAWTAWCSSILRVAGADLRGG
jgi:hypothetical protein